MIPFAATISIDAVTFTGLSGKNFIVSKSHPNDAKVREKIKEISEGMRLSQPIDALRTELEALADLPKFVNDRSTDGRVRVTNNVLYFDNEPVHSTLAKRILWGLSEGYDMNNYVLFLEDLMKNPSKRATDELFDFLEACDIGITGKASFLAYKRVRKNYTDIYTGTFDNSVGKTHSMPRNKVDEDKDRTCSYGFHFCSISYLPFFSSWDRDDRVMIVEIKPSAVVAIPSDYKNAKGRCFEYTVVGEYLAPDLKDILSTKAVWSQTDIDENFSEREWPEDESMEFDADCCGPADDEEDDEDLVQASMTPAPTGVVKLDSIFLSEAHYHRAKSELTVSFKNGTTYRYKEVPLRIGEAMLTTLHPGTFFNERIQGKYPSAKIK